MAYNVAHSVALAPRLAHSQRLLADTEKDLRRSLRRLRRDEGRTSPNEAERTVLFCLEAVLGTRKRLQGISGMGEIPGVVLPAIPVLRTASARLAALLPVSSGRLCELAVHLGSIVLDSAILAGEAVDIRWCGYESARMLDKAKLITDSKLRKLYPDIPSTCSMAR